MNSDPPPDEEIITGEVVDVYDAEDGNSVVVVRDKDGQLHHCVMSPAAVADFLGEDPPPGN